MFGQAVAALIVFLVLPLYTRLLIPANYGVAALILVTITFSSSLFSFGLNTGFMIKF